MTDKKKWKYYKDFCETISLDFFEDDVAVKADDLTDLLAQARAAMSEQYSIKFDNEFYDEVKKVVEKHKLENVRYEFYYDLFYESRRCGVKVYGKKPLSEAEKRRVVAKEKKKKERERKEYERLRKKFEGSVAK